MATVKPIKVQVRVVEGEGDMWDGVGLGTLLVGTLIIWLWGFVIGVGSVWLWSKIFH